MLAIEDAFEIAIPDADAAYLETPRQLIDYLCSRIGESQDGPPLVQVAFYRIRAILADELHVARREIQPSMTLRELAAHRDAAQLWTAVAERLGARRRDLVPSPLVEWLRTVTGSGTTIGAAAEQLAMVRPNIIRDRSQPWTRAQVTDVALRLLEREIGIDVRARGLDVKFVRDLGMD